MPATDKRIARQVVLHLKFHLDHTLHSLILFINVFVEDWHANDWLYFLVFEVHVYHRIVL